MLRDRQYFHSRSVVPMTLEEVQHGNDTDDESDMDEYQVGDFSFSDCGYLLVDNEPSQILQPPSLAIPLLYLNTLYLFLLQRRLKGELLLKGTLTSTERQFMLLWNCFTHRPDRSAFSDYIVPTR